MSSSKVNKVKIPEIKDIQSPEFLANLSYKELDVFADNVRDEILRVTSKNGGHLSSNLGVVEATIALHRVFDFKKDKLIFDVGHQCYTHKILTGRSLENLRKKGQTYGFQKITESEYDPFDAGHSSTSISAAQGMALARDLKGENYEIVAFIGDGSIASGLAFEGLNNLAHSHNKVIIVLNDNEMSISRPVGGLGKVFSKISVGSGYMKVKRGLSKTLSKNKLSRKILSLFRKTKNYIKYKLVPPTFFDSLGYTFIGPIDGHNIKHMEKAFKKAKNADHSVIIDIVTTKGKGYTYAEKDTTGYWHGVSPFNLETGKPLNCHEGYISWSHVMSDITLEEMEKHPEIVLISPATLKGSGLEDIFAKYPKRTFDVGIAEEHAMTMAGGLSVSGIHPIVDIYSTFMQRAYDEIAHDIARMNTGVTVLVDRAGLVGPDGETHQGIYDSALFLATPNSVLTMPSTPSEAKALFELSLSYDKGPFFIRFPRSIVKKDEISEESLKMGEWKKLLDLSKDRLVISDGPMIHELKDAIISNNKQVSLYNALFYNNLSEDLYRELLSYKEIIIYDPYNTENGFAFNLTSNLIKRGYKGDIKIYAIPNVFVKQATIKEQLEDFGLSVEQIIEKI